MGYNRQLKKMKKCLFLFFLCCLMVVTQSSVTTGNETKNINYVVVKDCIDNHIDGECGCRLYIDESVGFWYLKCKNTCDEMVKATCTYKIHHKDGSTDTHTVTNHIRAYSETVVTNGNYDNNYCEPISVDCNIVE